MSNTADTSFVEKQIQVYLQALVQQMYEHDDSAHNSRTVSKVGEHYIEVIYSSEMIEIAAFHQNTNELFTYTKFDRENELFMYSLRFHVVKDCLNDLLRLGRHSF